MEVWKKIEGFENYEVSNYGRIKSLNYNKTKKEKLLKERKTQTGYLRVSLCNNGKTFDNYIHRIVAKHFILINNDKKHINHIDGNKSNNHYANLEWCNSSENNYHAYNIGLKKKGEENSLSKLTNKEVLFVKESSLSYPELSKRLNVSKSLICYIKKGKNRKKC